LLESSSTTLTSSRSSRHSVIGNSCFPNAHWPWCVSSGFLTRQQLVFVLRPLRQPLPTPPGPVQRISGAVRSLIGSERRRSPRKSEPHPARPDNVSLSQDG
jgi:hypothetical protein